MTEGETFTQTTGFKLNPGDLHAALELARGQMANLRLSDDMDIRLQMKAELKVAWDHAVFLPPLLKIVSFDMPEQAKVTDFFDLLERFKPGEPIHALGNVNSWAHAKLQGHTSVSTNSWSNSGAKEKFDQKVQGAWFHVARAFALSEQSGHKQGRLTLLMEAANGIIGLPIML